MIHSFDLPDESRKDETDSASRAPGSNPSWAMGA
jgi:hypothetical protein